jgi:hypothetical protein
MYTVDIISRLFINNSVKLVNLAPPFYSHEEETEHLFANKCYKCCPCSHPEENKGWNEMIGAEGCLGLERGKYTYHCLSL